MNDFDLKAVSWDSDPMHRERSSAIAGRIAELIPLNKEMKALEFGAGTGITSFLLKDRLKEITLMDSSSGMIKVIEDKIQSSGTKNLKVLNFDLENNELTDQKFDLIFNLLVLHHITDIEKIAGRFYRLLNHGGYLATADIYEEDGSFHGKGFTGHNGFDIGKLSGILKKSGFTDIRHETCYTISKHISDTETRQFDLFLITARKE